MELAVYNIKGEDTGRKVTLSDTVFGVEPNDHAIYLTVRQYRANQRQGTHKAKERSEQVGSTRKLFRQKGTGGAIHLCFAGVLLYSDLVHVAMDLSSIRSWCVLHAGRH